MQDANSKADLWLHAFQQGSVWRRGLTLGLSVGVLQAVLNQGDHWLRSEVDAAVIIKTIISPLVTFAVVLVSAAATHVDRNSLKENYERLEVES